MSVRDEIEHPLRRLSMRRCSFSRVAAIVAIGSVSIAPGRNVDDIDWDPYESRRDFRWAWSSEVEFSRQRASY